MSRRRHHRYARRYAKRVARRSASALIPGCLIWFLALPALAVAVLLAVLGA